MYSTIAQCAQDPEFINRVTAAVSQEGSPPSTTVGGGDYLWEISAAQDIEAAYESAVAAGNEHPGKDESVITDGMILAYVQANPPTES